MAFCTSGVLAQRKERNEGQSLRIRLGGDKMKSGDLKRKERKERCIEDSCILGFVMNCIDERYLWIGR